MTVQAIPIRGHLDLNNNELQNAKLQLLTANPTAIEGKVYWHTTNDRIYASDGSVWRGLAFQDEISGALTFNDTSEIDLTNTTGVITAALINGSVGLARLANIGAHTYLGNNTGSGAAPIALTRTQLVTDLALVPGDISGFDTQVRTNRLDQMAAPTADVSLNSHKITNLANGTAGSDAITLAQLQAAIEGRAWKDSVDAATTGALPNTPTYNSGAGTLTASANAALAAQDVVTLAVGDRLLVKNQASTFQNGIYDVTAVGSGAAPWILTRSADASTAAELTDASVYIDAGSSLKGKVWGQTNTLADLTAAAQSWVVTGDVTVYTAGTGLTLTAGQFSITAGGVTGTELNASVAGNGLAGGGGSALSVNTDGTTLEVNSDALRIAASAAGTGLSGGGGSALSVNTAAGITTSGDNVVLDTTVAVRKYGVDVGDGTTTDIVVSHGLGSGDVQVEVYRKSDGRQIWVPWTVATSTPWAVTLNFDSAPTSAQFRAVVHV